ncbi:MAG: hypothetical protein ACREPI_05185 [Candidatus Dormibacterales bacterium]
MAELENAGFLTSQVAGVSDLVVVHSPAGFPAPSAISANPAVAAAGIVRAQSEDPALRSCNYKLADSPGGQALLNAAVSRMAGLGLLTSQEVASPSTIALVSDDPLDSTRVFVTVLLEKPVNIVSPPVAMSSSVAPFTALVDKTTGVVISAGPTNWFVGQ